MMNVLKKLLDWISGRKQITKKHDEQTEPDVKKKKKRNHQPKEHFGSHFYLGDLLDKLDRVFDELPKLRKADPEAFDLYSKLGATIRSSDALTSSEIEPYTLQNLPSFGCTFSGADADNGKNERVPFQFGYFVKETRPINVQATNGTVYRVGMTYHLKNFSVASVFYVAVEGNKIRPLKVCQPKRHIVGKGPRRSEFMRLEWQWPTTLAEIAQDNNVSIEECACEIFAVVANQSYAREQGITVSVYKSGLRAVFAVDMLRTPYFFADRERVVNENGSTKKILHICRGHYRNLAGGEKKFIKPHWRGLRQFEWNGYKVKIGMADSHGLGLSSFDLAAADPMEDGKDMLNTKQVAKKLDEVLV